MDSHRRKKHSGTERRLTEQQKVDLESLAELPPEVDLAKLLEALEQTERKVIVFALFRAAISTVNNFQVDDFFAHVHVKIQFIRG